MHYTIHCNCMHTNCFWCVLAVGPFSQISSQTFWLKWSLIANHVTYNQIIFPVKKHSNSLLSKQHILQVSCQVNTILFSFLISYQIDWTFANTPSDWLFSKMLGMKTALCLLYSDLYINIYSYKYALYINMRLDNYVVCESISFVGFKSYIQ